MHTKKKHDKNSSDARSSDISSDLKQRGPMILETVHDRAATNLTRVV